MEARTTDGDVVSVERDIKAPAANIFELLADPAKHPLIDGSGMVKHPRTRAAQRLSQGATFGMAMEWGKRHVRYAMVSTVIEFDEGRRIAWQSRTEGRAGHFIGGRIWRYELEPTQDGTHVRESWDISRDHQRWFLRRGSRPAETRRNMERTLERIEQLLAPAGQPPGTDEAPA